MASAVVFAYSEFGVAGLEALDRAGYDILLLITHRPDPNENIWFRLPADWAASHGIKTIIAEDVAESDLICSLDLLSPDFIFSFYYRNLLSEAVLAAARRGAYNLHSSLLPAYRGRAPINWVLVNGETVTGVTLHRMVKRADAGDIVAQRAIPISMEDTALTLTRKAVAEAAVLLNIALPKLADGTAVHTPQDISRGSYFGARRPKDGKFEWSWSAKRIYNLVRAVTRPWPGAFCQLNNGESLIIWRAVPVADVLNKIGEVRELDGLAIVQCGEGALRLHEVDYKSQTAVDCEISAFLRLNGLTRLK